MILSRGIQKFVILSRRSNLGNTLTRCNINYFMGSCKYNFLQNGNIKFELRKHQGWYFKQFSRTMLTLTQPKIARRIEKLIAENTIFIFAKSTCPFCKEIKQLFDSIHKTYNFINLDQDDEGVDIQNELILRTGQRTVPNVYIRNLHIGGCDTTKTLINNGKLAPLLDPVFSDEVVECLEKGDALEKKNDAITEFDLIVIGGGSGGNACAKEAAELGAKVCVLDFVKPSPYGTSWGYGGTCVNVGCIPKKLMHQASLIGEYIKDAKSFGYDIDREKVSFKWENLVSAVGDHIHSLNFSQRVKLKKLKITYMNAFGEFIDPYTLKCVNRKEESSLIRGTQIVVASGGRPNYPGIPGDKEYCITSDDLFWLPHHPGKTLIVGASYISLECAGFLREIGCDVTVMVRSIFLRGFDQDMAERVASYLESIGVKFITTSVPESVKCIKPGKPSDLEVHYKNVTTGDKKSDQFNTIILAIGREPFLKDLHLDKAGVITNPLTKKIITMNEQSSAKHIYALGDCAHESRQPLDKPLELTPVAIKAGIHIARKLYGTENNKQVDYNFIPTTVFTPLEYGAVGLSEDDALILFKDRIDVYHSGMKPLEWTVPNRSDEACYLKIIVLKNKDESLTGPENELVIGLHYLGPNAGEVTQGFALALKKNATKADFDDLVGIHPTCAESFTKVNISKSSSKDVSASGC